jgi:uncharacterized protein YdcH (DUF465 family)
VADGAALSGSLIRVKVTRGGKGTVCRDTQWMETIMSHTPHELVEDFPEHADRISELKRSDTHFARLVDDYHEVNRAVHRAETNVEPVSELAETELRKRRAALKDQIYGALVARPDQPTV